MCKILVRKPDMKIRPALVYTAPQTWPSSGIFSLPINYHSRNNHFPMRIIGEKKKKTTRCHRVRQGNATMGFRGTPHRSDGDRFARRRSAASREEGVRGVCAETCENPHCSGSLEFNELFSAPGNEMALRWAELAAGSPSEKSGRLPTIVSNHRMLLQIIQEHSKIY